MSRLRQHAPLMILVGAVLACSLIKTTAVPRAFGDEAWYAVPTVQLLRAGRLNIPILPGRGGLSHHYLQPKLTANLVAIAPVLAFGVSLFSFRLASVIAGLIAISFTYAFAAQRFGGRTAIVAAVATATNVWMFLTMRTFRPEVFVLAFTTGTLVLFTEALRARKRMLEFAAGLSAALAVLSHQMAAVFLPPACLMVFAAADDPPSFAGRLRRSKATLGWFGIGCLTLLAPYAAYVAIADLSSPASFAEQLIGEATSYEMTLPRIVAKEGARWSNFLALPVGLPVGILYAAAVVAALAGTRADRAVAGLALWWMICLAAFVPLETARYTTLCLPWLAIAVARLLERLLGGGEPGVKGAGVRWRRLGGRALAAGAAVFYLGAMSAGLALVFRAHWNADYGAFAARLAAHVPDATSRIAGPMVFWLAFHDRPYQVTNIPPHFGNRNDEPEAWLPARLAGADVILETTTTLQSTGGLSPRPEEFGGVPHLRLLRSDARARADVVAIERSRDFGPVRIWRVRRPSADAPGP